MRSSATSTRLTPLKLKSSSTRYTGGSAETCRPLVPRAPGTFWLTPTPWIVSPLRFTLTRWFGSSTPEPPQEHFDLLLGLEIAGSLSHLQPLPVRGPRLVGPARPLEGAAEAAVRGSVVRFEPDRLPILGDGVLGEPGIEIGACEAEADDGIVRHQLGHFLELGDPVPLGHARAAARPRLAGPVGNLDGERAEPVERGGAQERGEGGRVLGGDLQRLAHIVRVAARVAREVLENPSGKGVAITGSLGRSRHRQDLLVDGRGLRVAGGGRGAEGGDAGHSGRRGERFLGGGLQRLGMEGPRGEQDEGERSQDSHTAILTPLRGLL